MLAMSVLRTAITISKLARLSKTLAVALAHYLWLLLLHGSAISYQVRAEWLQRYSRQVLKKLDVTIGCHGSPPQQGVVISNHLSYLDPLVLGALTPMVFVAKSEVECWPLVGLFATFAGTIYVKRQAKRSLISARDEIRHVLGSEMVVGLFPEGTTSNGSCILPFKSSLFPCSEICSRSIIPVYIRYQSEGGLPEPGACYWGEMHFIPHLWNFSTKSRTVAMVDFDCPIEPSLDRKADCRKLYNIITGKASFYAQNTADPARSIN
jgi:1-acyl-sn-glycerol-3-phosphate acyltransferase